MVKEVKGCNRVIEITLDGTECAVKFDAKYNGFDIRNKSGKDITVSLKSGAAKGDDGVITIGDGETFNYMHMMGLDTVYITGSGAVAVAAKNEAAANFKAVRRGGETVDINPTSISENHNNIFLGDDLFAKGYDINDICAMISDGSFSDIYIGDYFTLSGDIANVPCFVEQTGDDGTKSLVESTQTVTYNTKFRIAGIDTYLNTGDTAFTAHHAVIVPDENIGTNRMNGTNSTTGGYVSSFMFASVLPVYNTHFSAKLNNHLLSHREILSNSVTGNQASGWAWANVKINLMSEPEVYGSNLWGNKYDAGVNYRQFPLFRIASKYICNRNWCWLNTIAGGSDFTAMTSNGNATRNGAGVALAVRPCFCIG
jgi:hypothetical protein